MARLVSQASERLGCPILIGGSTWHENPAPMGRGDEWLQKNSALIFGSDGPSEELYSKMHPVPFSEFVPFKRSWPWLHRLLRRFVPPVMSQLEPGDDPAPLKLASEGDGPPWYLATPICYEGTFARVCREMVRATPRERKGRLILANLSNDGWFVWRSGDGMLHDSTEHSQHLAAYCFRAVENRVPVVRAVNTGISASIDSNGRIVAAVEQRGVRTLINGVLLLDGSAPAGNGTAVGHGPRVLVDERVTVYSAVGDMFAGAVSVAAVAIVLTLAFRRDGKGKDKPRGS
jgi:apolipoprotein N-acyltransferase